MNKENLQLESLKQLEYFSVLEKVSKYAYSELGKEIILSTLPNPIIQELRLGIDQCDEMLNLISSDDPIPFDGISDIRSRLHKAKISGSVLSTNEILSIKDALQSSRLIKSYFKTRTEKYKNLSNLVSDLFENRMLEKHIDEAIDDTGNVRDNASKELFEIRKELNESASRLRNRIQKILKKSVDEDIIQENFYSMREDRYVIPVKAEYKRFIPGIIHGVSQTGSTVYLEPSEIIEMNNDISLLKNEESREIYRILSNLTDEVREVVPELVYSVKIIAELDSILAKATYASEFGASKPKIVDENYIELNKIYHPILVHKYGKKHVVPLTIVFDSDKRGHLISGPNAGGKTVALKSIALNIALALSGIFTIGDCTTNFRHIFTSIGDNQSIENNLSTFSSQITQLKEIIENSDENSLVLVDEICSGTDPVEGSALASAVIDNFIENKLFFVITTHQSSLKTYALNKSEIANASLEFNEEALKPTYKFLSGIPGNSYAFHLAKNVGLDAKVVKNAEKYLGGSHREMEESINLLNKYRMEAVKSRSEAEKLFIENEKLKKDFDEKLNDIKSKRKELVDNAHKEALDILSNANKLIENTIRQIKEDKKSPLEIKNEFELEKNKLKSKISLEKQNLPEEKQNKTLEFNPGDLVKIKESNDNSSGTILEIDKDKKHALVEFGDLKFKIKIKKLEKAENKSKSNSSNSAFSGYIKFDSTTRIDLRGMRAEEALSQLDVFISDAILGNLPFATILHGKGTGALRLAIQEFLKYHYQVLSYRDGDIAEGGAGVTVAYFS